MRERIGATSIESYFAAGERWGAAIDEQLTAAGADLSACDAVLDLGCGAGKVLQYLVPRYPEAQWFGCDMHGPSANWVNRHLPVTAIQNDYDPPLAFESDRFGCVFLCSVFTHLDRDMQRSWLRELTRVARPGGSLAISINGETSGYVTSERPSPSGTEIEDQGFIFRPYTGGGASYTAFAGTAREYGLSFQSHRWTREAWSDIVRIDAIVPRGLGDSQDLVIATVPGGEAGSGS